MIKRRASGLAAFIFCGRIAGGRLPLGGEGATALVQFTSS
jgi:hypothetical protein